MRLAVAEMAFLTVSLIAGSFILVRRFVKNESAIVRQQLKWVVWGSALAVTPFTLLYAAGYLFGVGEGFLSETTRKWMTDAAVLPLVLIPLTFGNSVVRYRLMDVDMVVRRTAVYASDDADHRADDRLGRLRRGALRLRRRGHHAGRRHDARHHRGRGDGRHRDDGRAAQELPARAHRPLLLRRALRPARGPARLRPDALGDDLARTPARRAGQPPPAGLGRRARRHLHRGHARRRLLPRGARRRALLRHHRPARLPRDDPHALGRGRHRARRRDRHAARDERVRAPRAPLLRAVRRARADGGGHRSGSFDGRRAALVGRPRNPAHRLGLRRRRHREQPALPGAEGARRGAGAPEGVQRVHRRVHQRRHPDGGRRGARDGLQLRARRDAGPAARRGDGARASKTSSPRTSPRPCGSRSASRAGS